MKIEIIIDLLEEAIVEADLKGFTDNLESLVQSGSDLKVSETLSVIFYKKYTRFKADSLAKFMEISIRRNPNIATVNHPENPLFKAAILRGSKDLYDCYIEEGVLPFLANVVVEEHEMHYAELFDLAFGMNEMLFPQYVECVKGMDYNSAFGKDKSNENISLIASEDLETMEDVIAKYNTIIVRRDILKDLSKRAGLE